MEKIKSVLSGHKKSDDSAHDHTASSTTAASHVQHPIYDQMAGPKHDSTAGQAHHSTGLGTQGLGGVGGREHVGTDGVIGTTHTGSEQPPHFSNNNNNNNNLNVQQSHPISASSTTSPGPTNTLTSSVRPDAPTGAVSEASIKSGVIGFGPSRQQEHAAQHAVLPNDYAAETHLDSNQILGGGNSGSVTGEQRNIQPSILPHSGTASHGRQDTVPSGTATHRPFEKSSQQVSYTADTDRSFPLSGGIASRDSEKTSSFARQLATDERQPVTTERNAGLHDDQGREGLARAAAAVATLFGASAPLAHSERREAQDLAEETRQATYRNQPATASSTTHNHHPEALAATTAASSKAPTASPFAHDPTNSEQHRGTHGDSRSAGSEPPITEQDRTGLLAGVRPFNHRTDTHPHIPGEFPDPTPAEDLSQPFFDEVRAGSTPATDAPSTQHELRHTGTLDQPRPKSGDFTPDQPRHHGRDAVIAGGVGAAGLGGTYAASQKHKTPSSGSPQGVNPYSATKLDPRVYGKTAPLEKQRIDPLARTEPPVQQNLPTHKNKDSSAVSASPVNREELKHHLGRDVALGGAGLATAGGLHHTSQRDERANTGPASHTIGPHSSNVANGLDPRVQPDIAKQSSHNMSGPHPSDMLNHLDPKADAKTRHHDHQHHGRDAAVVGGAGTAGFGAYEAAKSYGDHRLTQPEASMENQRYDPTATGARAPNPTPAYTEYNYNKPRSNTHDRDNRNAALGAGVGAAALGGAAYAGTTHHDSTRQLPTSENPVPITNYEQWKPMQNEWPASHTMQEPIASAIHPTQGSSTYNTQTPVLGSAIHPTHGTASHTSQGSAIPVTQQHYGAVEDPQDRSHDNRGAALLGTAGAATLTGAGYAHANQPMHANQSTHGAGYTHHNATQPTQDSTAYATRTPDTTSVHPPQSRTAYDTHAPATTTTHQHYDAVKDPTNKDHDKRSAAVLGTVGAAAAMGAGHAYAHKQDQQNLFETQERLAKMEKQHEKEQAKLVKDTYVQQENDQHKLDKERSGLQTSHFEWEEKEKKHGILGFLHRDKSKKERRPSASAESMPRGSADYVRESPRHSKDSLRESPKHSREYPDPRTTAAAYEALPVDALGRNRLHKDPPIGHPIREALEHPEVFTSGGLVQGKREHIGVDGPIGHPDLISGDHETRRNTYGAHPISDLDKDNAVIKPHTGLPMNAGPYSDGRAGTDANNTIEEHYGDIHEYGAASTTNWDAVKK